MQYSDLMRRTAFDAKTLGRSFLIVRSALASKFVAALGLACVFVPLGLIPEMMDTESSLRTALGALASADFIGITEDMDASMTTLGKLPDFEPSAKVPRLNVPRRFDRRSTTAGGGSNDRLSLLTLGELAWLTRIDDLICEAAYGRFHEARAEAGDERSRVGDTT